MKNEKIIKVWIVKYALTAGIKEIEVERCDDFPDMVREVNSRFCSFYHGKEWCLTYEEALKRAEEMRIKKIESLKKQIKKYEGMKFKEEPARGEED